MTAIIVKKSPILCRTILNFIFEPIKKETCNTYTKVLAVTMLCNLIKINYCKIKLQVVNLIFNCTKKKKKN